MSDKEKIDFGYETIDKDEKEERVAEVFHSVASKYDVMNDVMSMGVHRLWKRTMIELTGARKGQMALDLAGGTGEIAMKVAKRVGDEGHVVLSDINSSMLEEGRKRVINSGFGGMISFKIINAEEIPFPDNTFDLVTISFGLRNVTDKLKALKEMRRVTKPGGRTVVMEFSKPVAPGLAPIYDFYSFKALPLMGKIIANDEDSYRYLAESIRMHPDQETMKAMMLEAGFDEVEYKNLTGGIVAIHRGFVF
ncbi:bifunctional demethylmenaquinone methyltransferase/2-methoxy-6-polyprenyl-1,4-benzoquinol methylase [Wohlfahrtiimonas chitiniclastica]|uniref:bifunctional demethylmenaquinone methyltransferase/2-methoxy-6-polyprenyl-1,4-benzoquinol methylase UbiE n=1 Tax=Wohlfahrtiimonas TaxID=582472 RepID=UPI00035D8BFC|nr:MULTISPECIES: bifunctional demethylmenaquinone methyltransferase/2-methoxy-6-polyprenyl-1,4-benzoquinol methylase UbiE [Wohlfahrtiimonas]KZX36437.1 bifunctional demethylmenaquinone methyltransferase/2-methoxy-6-polyprenyl-1,4-benzoquinol methylase [Wohlfahrtiimonas chitiniclastica]MBS7826681.1 bifunctional demethylmenaquinone methyltransferase/2-methoxy-6-polyprenyl-1,4-benzoquinol methylase UbiE [Wohlfahrtiimonas chitiniclastica]OYQ70497.1 bifunctional demethylmenaquinone methyltransferase/2